MARTPPCRCHGSQKKLQICEMTVTMYADTIGGVSEQFVRPYVLDIIVITTTAATISTTTTTITSTTTATRTSS